MTPTIQGSEWWHWRAPTNSIRRRRFHSRLHKICFTRIWCTHVHTRSGDRTHVRPHVCVCTNDRRKCCTWKSARAQRHCQRALMVVYLHFPLYPLNGSLWHPRARTPLSTKLRPYNASHSRLSRLRKKKKTNESEKSSRFPERFHIF